jgi:hypothetical protein
MCRVTTTSLALTWPTTVYIRTEAVGLQPYTFKPEGLPGATVQLEAKGIAERVVGQFSLNSAKSCF